MKRYIRTPEYFEGKRMNPNKWIIPQGWNLCEQSDRLYREEDLLLTFFDWVFPCQWLRDRNIYVEDASWLSQAGYDEIVDILVSEEKFDYYIEAV